MADQVPFFKPGHDLTGHCTAAVVGGHLVRVSANAQADGAYSVAHCGAGQRPVGVAMRDGAIGDRIPFSSAGVLPIISTGALAAGTEVMSDATGQVVAWVTAAGEANVRVGTLMADVAAGAVAQVKVNLA